MTSKNSSNLNSDKFQDQLEKCKQLVIINQEEIDLLLSIPRKLEPIILKSCNQFNFPIKDIVPVGSSQRKTFLPRSRDIDIFVRFDTRDRKFLEQFAEQIIPVIADQLKTTYEIKYAENPYGVIHLPLENGEDIISIDLVATFWIHDEKLLQDVLKLSGMARTPFHTFFLNKKIKGLEEEVRLLKYWAKQKKLYRQSGFTGFIIELLILIYGSFQSVLENAREISTLIYDFNNRQEFKLRDMFKKHPIIIIDPIDENRNAAAGIHGILGDLHLKRFILLAQHSINDPESLCKEYNLNGHVFILKLKFKDDIKIKNEDEHYSRFGRILGTIFRSLKLKTVDIIDAIISVKSSTISITTNTNGGDFIIKKGPPIKFKDNCDKFRKKNPETWKENGFLWSKIPQKTVKELLNLKLSGIQSLKEFSVQEQLTYTK